MNPNSNSPAEQPNNNVLSKSNQSFISQQDSNINCIPSNDYYINSNPNDKLYHNYTDIHNGNYPNYIQKRKVPDDSYTFKINNNNSFQYQQNPNHLQLNEDKNNTIYNYSQIQHQIHKPPQNINYYPKNTDNISNYQQPIDQEINYNEMNRRIVENINDFYIENNRKHTDENIKSQNYKEKEGTFNLFDFYSNHNRYPLMNLFEYYFPSTPLNNNSK